MTVREEKTCVQTTSDDRAATIAALNDQLRCRGRGGTLCATAGVIALGHAALPAILAAVRGFTAFTTDNDPYGEHDFGALTWRATRLFWKIDYYDRAMQFGSPDPTDPAVTTRVFTVMLAEEW
jgi:hypothetical protein